MSISLTRILVRHRSLSIAIANAAITWTILIIAPLGLFAVIICTLAVFISSAIVAWFGDQALEHLLRLEQEQLRETEGNPVSIPSPPGFQGDRFPNSERRELRDR
ncbi:conserved exported hypothetical protein [Planktothrix serta PCC 8927]|uniref:Uncharacterized protein n=1 Tax=Planktothrix serta PCC 8927 TaxID=671068 RepID=A0A7Z9BTB2_9CYAN|nr:CRISPR-associated protein Csx18 [Planktothrix serta]VXD17587.1 conserved exported hypothetical protein [Planktothrix serta PCC 8927]